MDLSLENKIIYTDLNNIYIIKCECLDILEYIFDYPIHNIIFAKYCCDEVRIIELYDINKNIIDTIIDPIFKDPLKIGSIINLESFKKNILIKRKFYYKTYIRACMEQNKIYNIKYNISYNGKINGFDNDIVLFYCICDFSEFKEFDGYYTDFYNNNNEISHQISYNGMFSTITYFLYDGSYDYEILIYRDKIEILKIKKNIDNSYHQQIIICNKELKILQVLEKNNYKDLYEENRDINNVIIDIKKYNPNTDKLETILSNNNNNNNEFILIESKKNFSQELLDFYNLKINYLDNLISIRDRELNNAKIILLNENIKELL